MNAIASDISILVLHLYLSFGNSSPYKCIQPMSLRKYFIYCTYYLILVSTFLVTNIAFAQTSTGVFKGLVKDRNDQFVLIGVNVKMDSHYAVTDENGSFELTLPAGS